MPSYLILVTPSANRVYRESSSALMTAELRVLDRAVLGQKIHDVSPRVVGGVPYLQVDADELADADVAHLSDLSSLYALFGLEPTGLLRPITLTPADRHSSDLVTIQRYTGKTNESFTKLLLNVTAWSTDRPEALRAGRMSVLDPMCGRGTTLNQALMYGLDATGVDVDAKDFEAYSAFLRTWLKNKRMKHRAETTPLRRDRRKLGRRLDVTLADTKERFRAGEAQTLVYVHGDTRRSAEIFRPGSFDVVVGDAPYGVQHGSRGGAGEDLSRSPLALVEQALPAWVTLLRPGGALGLSWNTKVAGRAPVERLLADAGLEVQHPPGFDGFAHRVDQAIVRDLVVARKPAAAHVGRPGSGTPARPAGASQP